MYVGLVIFLCHFDKLDFSDLNLVGFSFSEKKFRGGKFIRERKILDLKKKKKNNLKKGA